MTKVLKKIEKANIFPTSLESLPKNVAESLDYCFTAQERMKQVYEERIAQLEQRIEAQERRQEIRDFYSSLKAELTKNLFRGLDLGKATKQATCILLFASLLPSCKAIEREHERLEYREAQQFLEWQKEDLKKPLPLPYSLHEALLSEKGGQQ